jgi:hypothetical protein
VANWSTDQIDRPYNRNQSLSKVVTTRLRKGSLERLEKALERLECPSKLVKRCHNQADKGFKNVERLDAKAVCLSVCPTGVSLLR